MCVCVSPALAVARPGPAAAPRVLPAGLGACCRRKSCGSRRALAAPPPGFLARAALPGARPAPRRAAAPSPPRPARRRRRRVHPPGRRLPPRSPPASASPPPCPSPRFPTWLPLPELPCSCRGFSPPSSVSAAPLGLDARASFSPACLRGGFSPPHPARQPSDSLVVPVPVQSTRRGGMTEVLVFH